MRRCAFALLALPLLVVSLVTVSATTAMTARHSTTSRGVEPDPH